MNRLQRNLRASLGDGAFFSLMVGMGETYLAAFALALQAGEIATGLLAAVPMLLGALLQLGSPPIIRRLGSNRKWVVGCAICQGLSLLVMPLAIQSGRFALVLLYGAATLYWAAGQATGPAWNTWIEELVPKDLRASFFAGRSRLCQLCVLCGFVGAGLFLHYGQQRGFPLFAFTVVLSLAAVSRLVSAFCLALQSEAPTGPLAGEHLGLRQVIRDLRGHEGARLCVYLFAVQVAVQISGPYFSPFMLAQLKLSYAQFMLLVSLGVVGKVLALAAWGKLAHAFGARLLMWIGGVGITPLAGLWLGLIWLEQPMMYLAVVQVVGGVAWAAYELAFLLMFFETIPRHERISVLTLYNVGNALAMAMGAVIGASLLTVLGESKVSYLALFTMSSACRVLALVFLARVPKMQIEVVVPALRILTVRSSDEASVDRPVLPTIPDLPPQPGPLPPNSPQPDPLGKRELSPSVELPDPERAKGSSDRTLARTHRVAG